MARLGDTLKTKIAPKSVKKVQSWQDLAVYYAEKLDIDLKNDLVRKSKLIPQWFRLFKISHEKQQLGKLDRAYSYISDHPNRLTMSDAHKIKLFFKMYYVKRESNPYK